jgi:chromosome segregation ATPase
MVAEGTLPRTSADFGLSVENATLKMERDKLARELWEGAQKQEAAAATEKARLAGLSMIYEQKLKTLQEKVERLESSLRESRQAFYEEKTQLLASSRAIELQLAERQKELQQLKSERASLAEDLAQAYRLKDDWTNKYLGCRDEALSFSRELASRATRMCVLEREVSRLSEHQVDTQETERVDVETERLRARVSKLAGQLRRREDRVAGLKREREELRMALAKERQVMKEVLRESHGTLRELGSLLDSRSV